jgi:ABC-type phosphate transport system substrate-binding protein
MATRRTVLLSLLLPLAELTRGGSAAASGELIAVIVNKANPLSVIGRDELRPIFQTTRKVWSSGAEAFPINLPEDSPLRNDFDQAILGLDPERVARYWIDRKVRGGARPPVRVNSSSAVLKAVASKPGAVGYVRLGEVNNTVKVVAKVSDGKLSPP